MEVIRLTGYDLQEKMKIAEQYLVPNAMLEAGLKQKESKKEAEEVSEPEVEPESETKPKFKVKAKERA